MAIEISTTKENTTLPNRPPKDYLGFGAAAIGNLYQPICDQLAHKTVGAAIDAGLQFFDTAPFYGFGLSEKRLGRVLAEKALPHIQISTKVGRRLRPYTGQIGSQLREGFASNEPWEAYYDYSYDGIMRSFDSSLSRLGIDSVHLLLVHDLDYMTHGNAHQGYLRDFLDGGYRAMEQLKNDGRVNTIGLGVKEVEMCLYALQHFNFDTFLLAGRYTLLDQSAQHAFLPECQSRGIKVHLASPFNSGILATGVLAKSSKQALYYEYQAAPDTIISRVNAIQTLCTEFEVSLQAAALQFALANPVLDKLVTGFASEHQLVQALAWLQEPIPHEFWQQMQTTNLLSDAAPVPEGQ